VSFKVVTGHEAPNKEHSQVDWESMKADETIVFLMGLHNLGNIAENLIRIGRPETTPCAVISRGTTSEQKSVTGTLADIHEKVKEAGIQTPALIVVGKVVDLKKDLEWIDESS